jgi:hypothetical protein
VIACTFYYNFATLVEGELNIQKFVCSSAESTLATHTGYSDANDTTMLMTSLRHHNSQLCCCRAQTTKRGSFGNETAIHSLRSHQTAIVQINPFSRVNTSWSPPPPPPNRICFERTPLSFIQGGTLPTSEMVIGVWMHVY